MGEQSRSSSAHTQALSRSRWISDVWTTEIISFAVWFVAEFALSFAATLDIVHRGTRLPAGRTLSDHFLASWAVTWGGSMLLFAIVAGGVVFRRATPWGVVLTWPWLVGPVVGFASFIALTPHMDSGSRMCDAPAGGSCDTSWGLGAMLLSLVAAATLGTSFIAVASLKKALLRLTSST